MKWIFTFLMAFILSSAGCASAETGYIQIDQETAKQMMAADDGHIVVDERRQDEYGAGHIPGAILIPNESIGCDSPEALPDYDQVILIYCRSGNRSKQAAQKLASMGYTSIYEFGGIMTWTGEIVTPEEEKAVTEASAVLRFSSFSGGGYDYSVEVDDPSVVRCEARYAFEAHAEEIDGASYDYIVTFTGLKPGATTAAIYGCSPIMDNENSIYTVSVDDGLQVTLTPVRAISTFFVYRSGEIRYDSYKITFGAEGYRVSVNEKPEQPLSAAIADALMAVIDRYEIGRAHV